MKARTDERAAGAAAEPGRGASSEGRTSSGRGMSPGRGPRPGGAMRAGRAFAGIVPIGLAGAVFLVVWQSIVVIGGYRPFILPGPGLVASRFVTAWIDGTMAPHFVTTLSEVALGFAAGAIAALAVGTLIARSTLAERLVSPYLVAAQATPILALAPLIALWFGTGLTSKVIITALIVFFPVAIATMVGIRSVDRRLIEMARSYRASRRDLIFRIELPSALPSILGGMRVGITLSVIGAIVGEWTGGDSGLGVLINLARGSLFDTPLMFATLMTIGLLGMALYLAMVLIEHRLVGER